MNLQSTITLILALVLTIWAGAVFLHVVNGSVLWKTLASGIGFLTFGALFIVYALRLVSAHKKQK